MTPLAFVGGPTAPDGLAEGYVEGSPCEGGGTAYVTLLSR